MVLIFVLKVSEDTSQKVEKKSVFVGCAEGIVGGIIVSSGKVKGSSAKMIYISAMISFLLGDVMMEVGKMYY